MHRCELDYHLFDVMCIALIHKQFTVKQLTQPWIMKPVNNVWYSISGPVEFGYDVTPVADGSKPAWDVYQSTYGKQMACFHRLVSVYDSKHASETELSGAVAEADMLMRSYVRTFATCKRVYHALFKGGKDVGVLQAMCAAKSRL